MNRFLGMSCGCFLFAAGFAAAADLTVGNSRISVRYEEQSRRLALSERASGKVFAVAENFAPAGSTVKVGTCESDTLKGDALRITHPDGCGDLVMVDTNAPFVLFTKVLKVGAAPSVTNRVPYAALTLDLGVPPAALNTLGTGGLLKPDKNPGSYMWAAVADPATRRGVVAGWVTTRRGSGVVRLESDDNAVRLLPHVDYGRLLLPPGEERGLEMFAVGLFDDARLGLEAYADTLAKVHDIHLPPMPTVHCTWYVDGASNENVMTGRTAYAAQALKPFGLGVMQIDDGWQLGQTKEGPMKVFINHNPKGPYPSGMKSMADTVRSAGMTAGLWLIPFAGSSDDPWFADKKEWFAKKPDGKPYDTRWGGTCFDLTREDTKAYLKDVIRTLTQEWGYNYLKMDGLYTGAALNLNYVCDTFREDEIGQAVLSDPKVTQIEMMRDSLKLVRETAGKDVFLLGCCEPQNMRSAGAAFGLVDAMRIGPDNGASWADMQRGPEFGAWQYFLNRRVWYNDPDPLYVRDSLPLEHAQTIVSWVTLSGQMNSSSEDYAKLPADRLDLLKRTMPSHNAVARPVDLFENRVPGIWLVTDTASGVRRDAVGLFNWDGAEKIFDTPLSKIGIPGDGEFIAFDFWGNTLTPPFKGRLTQTLRPQSCRVLSVRPVTDHPQLISTSRHITQGMVDVKAEKWDAKNRTLSGVSAVVANDPYELRVLTYTSQGMLARQKVVAAPDDVQADTKVEEGLIRITLRSTASRDVRWSVTFTKEKAAAVKPAASAVKAEMPDIYGPAVVTWSSTTRACELRRDGEVVAQAATGGVWRDARIQSEKSYRYEVIPYTLGGERGEPQSVTFKAPAIPQLGDVPPKPEVKLDTLEPVKQAVGWGTFKKGTSLNGPLTLGKETFTSGICIHADGYAVYARDPSWSRFVAIVGIDESQRPANQSSVIFSVAVEAADARRVLATSPVIRFGQRERWHFNVEIPKDAVSVVLLSESAGDGNKSDHGDWCDAGFIK